MDINYCRCYIEEPLNKNGNKTWKTPIDEHTIDLCLELDGKEIKPNNLSRALIQHYRDIVELEQSN